MIELHHQMFQRLNDNSSIFYSTDSEEEEKKKKEQSKHDKHLLEPVYKRITQLEKMITDQNKELSQMQRLAKQHHGSILPSPGRGKGQFSSKGSGGVRFKTDDDFELFYNEKGLFNQNDNSKIGGSFIGLRLNQVDEDDRSPSNFHNVVDMNSEIFERRLYKHLYDMRKDLLEKMNKKQEELDHKFSVEIAKIQNIIDTELGLEDENDIMEEDDSADSESTPKKKSSHKSESQRDQQNAINVENFEDEKQGANDNEENQADPNSNLKQQKTQGLNNPTLPLSQPSSNINDRAKDHKKSIRSLERANIIQRTLNELERKLDIVHKMASKFNDYYDSNHLRINSVQEIVIKLESMEKAIDQKANSLDLKKIMPIIHELTESMQKKEDRYAVYEKGLQQIETSFNNTQKQNNYKLQISEQRYDAIQKDIGDIRKDIEIKFGSKNLLNFGLSSQDTLMKKEVKEHIKKYVEDRINHVIGIFDNSNKETHAVLSNHEEVINLKADLKLLEETHEKFSVQLEKHMQSSNKKFMDKAETKKTFKMFEKQLKNIFDIILSKFEEQDLTDAMLAKKPLGGWSCISCQKNITNMSGAIAEYQVQGRFPWRDPQDRLQKVGAGFSQMLSRMRPETTINEQRTSKLGGLGHSASQQNLRQSIGTAQSSIINPSFASNTDLAPVIKGRDKVQIKQEDHQHNEESSQRKSSSQVKYQPPSTKLNLGSTKTQGFNSTMNESSKNTRQPSKLIQLDPLSTTSNFTDIQNSQPIVPNLKNIPVLK
ncbi:UNKNOWN [Stylonychia lemnae]|uniref:Uncharacterized protein n=1 Tax=Stylonychia lemnae TaxID=5949 RepID=A0A077ZS28_STYLE|nr:UNKNOWN [Stylonychia lemnae]|eukprot:CDW71276.1 UNKNOWN [Stylonychia lemnae]